MTIQQRPINMDKVREKLEKLKNPGAFRKNPDKWSPKKLAKGETTGEVSNIRLIRYPWDDDPFLELHFHYGVGEGEHRNFLCLKKNFQKDCPACTFASALWNSEQDSDKELAKQLFANNRQHALVVDREDEVLTPKYWGFGVKVYNELASKLQHAEYKDYMDYYKGIDLEVKYEKTSGAQQYPGTTLLFSRASSVLTEPDDEIQRIIDAIKKPEEIWKPLTKSEIEAQLNGWLSSEESANASSTETVKGGNDAKEETAKAVDALTVEPEKTMSVADVDAAFEDALSDIAT